MILIDFFFWRKTPAKLCNVVSTFYEQCFDEKPSFRKINNFFISLDFKCKVVVLLLVFLSLRIMSHKLTVFRQKTFGSFIKTAFYVLPAKNWRKIVVWKKHNVLFFFRFSASDFLVMDEKFLIALLQMYSTCLANVSRKLDILKFVLHLSGFEQEEVGLLVKIFQRDCRNHCIRFQKLILTRNIFL